MADHESARRRLRLLIVAQNAIAQAIDETTRELVGDEDAPADTERDLSGLPAVAASGLHPRADPSRSSSDQATRAVTRFDVERHVALKWEASTTDDDRQRVRDMIESSAANGSLDPEAVERLRAMSRVG